MSTASHKAEILSRWEQGETLEQIGQRMGVTRERIRQLLKEWGAGLGGRRKTADDKAKARMARLNERSLRLRGITHEEFKALPKAATAAYRQQRRNAKTRGIEWRFNLASWWRVWQASGKWPERGRGRRYVMARKGDTGPYSPDNVYICTGAQNTSDQYIWKPFHSRTRKNDGARKLYEHDGRRLPLKAWAREFGLDESTLAARVHRGWDFARCLTEPVQMTNSRLRRLAREVRA